MKSFVPVALTAAISVLTLVSGVSAAQHKEYADSVQSNVNLPVTELHFGPTGVTAPNGTGSLQAAPAFGDLSKGEHGTFIKMPAGFISAIHTHTEAYFGVVVTGVGANASVGEKEIPLPPGSYWFQPGGKPHVTRCISTTECIFFIHQPGKFDYVPVAR
jgi:quercetin dioxygenase-like cupin family protein